MEEKAKYITGSRDADNPQSPTLEIRDRRKSYFYQTDNDFVLVFGKSVGVYGIAVYSVLAAIAGKKEKAWPSRKTMAEILGISIPSVDKGLRALSELNIIEIENRYDDRGQASNIYTLRDISEWRWENDIDSPSRGRVNDIDSPLSTSFTHPVSHVDTNNTQLPIPTNQQDSLSVIDNPYTYYRVNIAGTKKLNEAIETQIDHMVMQYKREIVLEAMKQALLGNRKPGKPTFNFIEAIAKRLYEAERTDAVRAEALRRSEEGQPAQPTLLDESFTLTTDGLSAYRQALYGGQNE